MIIVPEHERRLIQNALEIAARCEEQRADMIKPASATRETRANVRAWRKLAKQLEPKPIKPALSHRRAMAKIELERPIIRPVDKGGDCRQGTIDGLPAERISELLGFAPNIKDDECKVVNSWGFTVDGARCGVWDYYGSHKRCIFSTWGPHAALRKVFGPHYRDSTS